MTRGLRVATGVAREGLLSTLSRVSEINDQPPLPKPASCGFFLCPEKTSMLQFKAPQDLHTLPDSPIPWFET